MMHRLFLNARTAGAHAVNALSPVRIFQTQQLKKMGARAAAHTKTPTALMAKHGTMARSTPGWRWAQGRKAMGQMRNMEKVSAYFKGHYFDTLGNIAKRDPRQASRAMYDDILRRNRGARRGAAGLIAGATIGTAVLGANSLLSQASSTGLGVVGAGMGIAGALEGGARMRSPLVGGIGAGVLATSTVYNLLNKGDQLGPF